MKLFNCLLVIVLGLVSLVALAADAPVPISDAVIGLISAVKVGTLGAILIAVGQLLKSDVATSLLGQINTKALPYITLAIGVIASVGQSILAGKPWYLGVLEGVIASIASNKIYDHYTGQ